MYISSLTINVFKIVCLKYTGSFAKSDFDRSGGVKKKDGCKHKRDSMAVQNKRVNPLRRGLIFWCSLLNSIFIPK